MRNKNRTILNVRKDVVDSCRELVKNDPITYRSIAHFVELAIRKEVERLTGKKETAESSDDRRARLLEREREKQMLKEERERLAIEAKKEYSERVGRQSEELSASIAESSQRLPGGQFPEADDGLSMYAGAEEINDLDDIFDEGDKDNAGQ